MRPPGRDLGDQDRQLLVGDRTDQRPVAPPADVDRDERLDPAARLELGEGLRWRRLLAAVAAVREQRHVAGPGLPEVRAERVDHRRARGLPVDQGREAQPVADPSLEERAQVPDVVAAPEQRVDRRRIRVDPDQ